MKRILVVNSTYPHLLRVATALTEAGCLSHYVSLYNSTESGFELALGSVPRFGRLMRLRLANRLRWAGLERGQIVNGPLPLVVARDVLSNSQARRPWVKNAERALTIWLDRYLGRVASKQVSECDAVLAVNNCALESFRRAKALGVATFLDYPIGHHREKIRAIAAEAERWPDYASSWREGNEDPRMMARQDEEIELADRIWVGSDFVKRTFESQGVASEKMAILSYGTDLGRFHGIARSPKPGPVTCLFAGQVNQRKGASYLFEAFRTPFKSDVRLLLAGKLGVDLSLVPPSVTVLGHQRLPEMNRLYAEADIFVLPTLWEGMPLSILEAMAAGLPIVATPCGPAQVVRDGVDGIIVPDRDSQALHDAIERLAGDPALRAKMGAEGRERSKLYTWERYQEQCLTELGCATP